MITEGQWLKLRLFFERVFRSSCEFQRPLLDQITDPGKVFRLAGRKTHRHGGRDTGRYPQGDRAVEKAYLAASKIQGLQVAVGPSGPSAGDSFPGNPAGPFGQNDRSFGLNTRAVGG